MITERTSDFQTHTVENQPPPLQDYNPVLADRVLTESLEWAGAAWALPQLVELGARAGSAEAIEWGFLANRNPPVLRTHDRFGNRIDEVDFHPAWHRLMEVAVGNGLHASPWRDPRPGAHVARAAMFYTWSQVEGGHGCPVSMTYAVIPALRRQPEVARQWEPLITSLDYDPGLRSPMSKRGLLFGMAMTEKQGGSDVRANSTTATPVGATGPGSEYLLNGHKWFCSAPMCDAFLVLAQAPGGLSCFLLPRVLPDGTRNSFMIQRLKDKLGNRSNASSEIELRDTLATMIGEEGRGVRTIIEMVNHTRLDCVIGSAALMRQAVSQATHHTSNRRAFGKLLTDQPLMLNVLADLAVEAEATIVVMMRLAAALDSGNESESHFRRLALAVSKYWTTKRAIAVAAEALECHGGNGYVEESVMPRIYREAPLNSIWEGSGNVNALDALRAMAREPESLSAFMSELELAHGMDPAFDAAVAALGRELSGAGDVESGARRIVERMAVLLQGSLLLRHGSPGVASAFCRSRVAGDWGSSYGTLPSGLDLRAIVDRHTPHTGHPVRA
ncbi:MAG: acyl-CoA dehydrogenase family protein [Candidatus Dormibacteria bacterium]